MKKVMLVGSMLIIALSSIAQIVPVENAKLYRDAGEGIPEGIYLKDINNLFNGYIGNWKGNYNNKNYTFEIKKFTEKRDSGVTEDMLIIRYAIVTTDGTILETTLGTPDKNVTIVGDYFAKGNRYYVFNYYPKDFKCAKSGQVYLHKVKNSNNAQITLQFYPDNSLFSDINCLGKTMLEPLFPYDYEMVLSKQ